MKESVFNGEEHAIPLSSYDIKPRLMIGRTDISEYLDIDGLEQAVVHEYFLYDQHRLYRWCSPQEYHAMNHLGYDYKDGFKIDLEKIPAHDISNEEYWDDGEFIPEHWLDDQLRGMNYEPCTDGHPDQSILLWDTATGEKGKAWDYTIFFDEEDHETFAEMAHAIQEDLIEYINGN